METVDNPGWRLLVDLEGTELEAEPFEEYRESHEDGFGWVVCREFSSKFEAAVGPEKPEDMISVFLLWSASRR